MEKLSEEERERIRKEAYENALELYHFESEAVRGQYAEILIKGMESECLKKNEEIERLRNELIIEISSSTRLNLRNQIYSLESDREVRIARELTLEDKLQVSEQRVKELEDGLRGIERNCDNQNHTHETIWRIANQILTKQ